MVLQEIDAIDLIFFKKTHLKCRTERFDIFFYVKKHQKFYSQI
jgi:hypothetical protein